MRVALLILCLSSVAFGQDGTLCRYSQRPEQALRFLVENPVSATPANGTMALPAEQIIDPEEEDPGSSVPS